MSNPRSPFGSGGPPFWLPGQRAISPTHREAGDIYRREVAELMNQQALQGAQRERQRQVSARGYERQCQAKAAAAAVAPYRQEFGSARGFSESDDATFIPNIKNKHQKLARTNTKNFTISDSQLLPLGSGGPRVWLPGQLAISPTPTATRRDQQMRTSGSANQRQQEDHRKAATTRNAARDLEQHEASQGFSKSDDATFLSNIKR
ncbi:hypothetical protein F5Y16DRAFT_420045 [Xylariaceae sp. FL0255]|nr:hypothetical protein F5Y16DRAFT_420045 [Xylariaceae sp. FL0255]